jgi:hypothetical protein
MSCGERPEQQDNCSHGQPERKKNTECYIGLGQTTRYRGEAGGFATNIPLNALKKTIISGMDRVPVRTVPHKKDFLLRS